METGDPELKQAMRTRNQALAFGLLCAVSILFWWHPLITTLGLTLANDAYTHILLILPLGAALIYLDSKELRIDPQPAPRSGAALLALALLIGCYAKWRMGAATGAATNDVRLSLSMFALVTWWIASVVFCFGLRAFRSLLFPLCFLFLIVPVPDVVLNVIVEGLQHGSAWMAALLFRVIGEPVQRDGILLSLQNLDLEVAKECSSIRSSCLLVVTAMVLAHLFLRSWWRKALLIAAAIPLSVAKNGLRIVTIGELGTRVDPEFLNGKLHHDGGIIFFGVAVVAVGALLWMLRRTELRIPLPR
jgi:exosortase